MIDLSRYINAADISAADVPHIVVEKLQRAIDAANSATVGEEEIKRFRVGDILFSDEQATIFCDLALKGVRAEIVHKHENALRATEAGDWLPLLEMFSESEVLLHGAAGEDAMNVGDVVKLVRALALAQVELRAARELYAMASIAPSATPSAWIPVNERLPADSQQVLLWGRHTAKGAWWKALGHCYEGRWWVPGFMDATGKLNGEITHWRETPEDGPTNE